jgi:sulfatase maturation enzyme AslB (radical SAM superfamily)
MIISINPTYYCNFRCNFCYLTEQQLSDKKTVSLDVLEERIKEVQFYKDISMVDLYGGEVGLLPETYVNLLIDMLHRNNIEDINIITNLSMVNNVILNENFYITVSYDFEAREQHDRVWNNMLLIPKPFAILILAGPTVLSKDVDEMIFKLNMLKNLESVEIKPYSTNQSNNFDVTHKEFEEFVKKWITSPIDKKFTFVNEKNIRSSLASLRNAFSNDHVYITPSGKFAVLEFDIEDKEYFLELNSFEEYLIWADKESDKNVSEICKSCEYYGKCLTEHYRYVKNLDNSCNGYKFLLDWFKNNKI